MIIHSRDVARMIWLHMDEERDSEGLEGEAREADIKKNVLKKL